MTNVWPRLRLRRRSATAPCGSPAADCAGICALTACMVGSPALVLRVECPAADACRLRALGVYEGARVVVIDGRNGYLLDVRGSRLAVDRHTASSIVVRPMEAA